MAVEMFSWPSLHERMCRTWGSNSGLLACQANSLPIELPRPSSMWQWELWILLFTGILWYFVHHRCLKDKWAPSSEFVSSSIPSWHISTAHAQPFRGARDLAFFLKVPLDSLLVWASSEGSGETARMRWLAWTFAARTGGKYQIRLTRSKYACLLAVIMLWNNPIKLMTGPRKSPALHR